MKHTERAGLYIMVFITMVVSCESNDKLDDIERELKQAQQTAVCYKEEQ